MVITNPDGSTEEVEVLIAFRKNDNNQEYVIYTKNEIDHNGRVTIYASKTIRDSKSKNVQLVTVPDDEWSSIRTILRELSGDEEAEKISCVLYDNEGNEII